DREHLQPVELLLHRLGRVEADRETDAVRRELFAELGDACAQRAPEPDQVRAFLLKHDEADRVLAVDAKRVLHARDAHLDVRHVLELDGPLAVDADFAERGDAAGPAVEHDLPALAAALAAAEVAQPPDRLAQDL